MSIKSILSPPDFTTKLGERVSYWSYFVGQNIFYNVVTTFMATYLMMNGIDLGKIAVVTLIVKIWDAVNDPLFGIIFDKIKFKNGQKCLPWLRLSVGLIPITTVLLFIIPSGMAQSGKLIWFMIAYLLWDSSYTVCDVPIYSMVTTMTDNINERNTLMSLGRLFSGAGMGLSGMLCTLLVSEKVGLSFSPTVILLSVLGLLFMIPLCFVGKERNYHGELEDEAFSIKRMLMYLVRNKYLLIYYLGYLFANGLMTGNALSLFVSYYLFGSANFNIILGILSTVPSIVVALLIPVVSQKFDKFKLFFICNTVAAVLGLVMYFIGWQNKLLFIVLMIIRCLFTSVTGTLGFMFTPDCAEYGQYKTGVDAKGITFSIQTFTTKIAAAVASSLGLAILGFFDWTKIEAESFADIEKLNIVQSATALNGLWVTYILVPSIGLAITSFIYLFYRLRDKDVQIMAKYNAGEITREEAENLLPKSLRCGLLHETVSK
ncbi:MAG: MFS transporter [Clostridiaceae bacterium]|nr:MFS transporter [Clostridiaceae bacterium]MDY5889802.1 MFS transporter [Oscillospiraceae bacterium]